MKKRILQIILFAVAVSSCVSTEKVTKTVLPEKANEITYHKFKPSSIQSFKLIDYEVNSAHEIDSIILLTAYSDGDLETAQNPTNWGDRLMLLKDDSILFESKPVGDPYRFEPYFYNNAPNNKTVIFCQLGNEEDYGGQLFLLEQENIQFIGDIEFETPYDLPENNCVADILEISEQNNTIYFKFKSDSVVYLGDDDYRIIASESLHYKYHNNSFELFGFK